MSGPEPNHQNRSSPHRRPTPALPPLATPTPLPLRPPAASATTRRFTRPAPIPTDQRTACPPVAPNPVAAAPPSVDPSSRLGCPAQVYLAGRGRESAAQAADSLARKPRREAINRPGAGRRPVGFLGPTSRDQQPGTITKKPTTRGQQGPGGAQTTWRSTWSAITARVKAYPTPSCGSSPATWRQPIGVRMSPCPSRRCNPATSPVGQI
jgi:hypothetical protein